MVQSLRMQYPDAYVLHISMGRVSSDLGSTGICSVASHGKLLVQRELRQTGGLSWYHKSDASEQCIQQVNSGWTAHVFD